MPARESLQPIRCGVRTATESVKKPPGNDRMTPLRIIGRRGRFSSLAVSFATLISQGVASAYSIEDVTVLPSVTVTSDDQVSLEILIFTPTYPAFLTQATEAVVAANDIPVDIFVDSGPLRVIDYLID